MKLSHKIAVFGLVISGDVIAQEQSESDCKSNVEAIISAIELTQDTTGSTQSIRGMEIRDIRELQKSSGNCETLKELNKRMSN